MANGQEQIALGKSLIGVGEMFQRRSERLKRLDIELGRETQMRRQEIGKRLQQQATVLRDQEDQRKAQMAFAMRMKDIQTAASYNKWVAADKIGRLFNDYGVNLGTEDAESLATKMQQQAYLGDALTAGWKAASDILDSQVPVVRNPDGSLALQHERVDKPQLASIQEVLVQVDAGNKVLADQLLKQIPNSQAQEFFNKRGFYVISDGNGAPKLYTELEKTEYEAKSKRVKELTDVLVKEDSPVNRWLIRQQIIKEGGKPLEEVPDDIIREARNKSMSPSERINQTRMTLGLMHDIESNISEIEQAIGESRSLLTRSSLPEARRSSIEDAVMRQQKDLDRMRSSRATVDNLLREIEVAGLSGVPEHQKAGVVDELVSQIDRFSSTERMQMDRHDWAQSALRRNISPEKNVNFSDIVLSTQEAVARARRSRGQSMRLLSQLVPSYASTEEANAAGEAGDLSGGDVVIVGNQVYRWRD